jgi:hypothetical protein
METKIIMNNEINKLRNYLHYESPSSARLIISSKVKIDNRITLDKLKSDKKKTIGRTNNN